VQLHGRSSKWRSWHWNPPGFALQRCRIRNLNAENPTMKHGWQLGTDEGTCQRLAV
jgi:hypothetical protein